MGYRLNCLDEPVLIAVPKPLLTEFSIHHRLESCAHLCQHRSHPARQCRRRNRLNSETIRKFQLLISDAAS